MTIFQQDLRNLAVKPSGPGALSNSIASRDCLLEFLETGTISELLAVEITLEGITFKTLGEIYSRGLSSV